jgi:hypothetical protein
MLHRVALVRTDVSGERIVPIIKVTRIGEPGTTLAVTSNRSTTEFLPSVLPSYWVMNFRHPRYYKK